MRKSSIAKIAVALVEEVDDGKEGDRRIDQVVAF